ncbi:MAG TPA: hypothetical protein VGS12_08440 [Caulobacteraceae bacterium]|nr:hypothetical protein [Caulobacteraceae bacterium]
MRRLAVLLTMLALSLAACANAYVAGDVGAHHASDDKDRGSQ